MENNNKEQKKIQDHKAVYPEKNPIMPEQKIESVYTSTTCQECGTLFTQKYRLGECPKCKLTPPKEQKKHCNICGNIIPNDTSTCAEAGFGEGCGKTLENISTPPKALREEELNWEEKLWGLLYEEYGDVGQNGNIKDFIYKLLKQDRERIKEKLKGDEYFNYCHSCNCDALDRFLQILDEEQL